MRATPGAVDVGLSTRGQKPELNVEVNRGLAGPLNVSLAQLAQSLRYAFAGVDAGTWVDPSGISRYVHVRLAAAARENASDLGQLPVVLAPTVGGGAPTFVPLSQVATITQGYGPAQIDHYQRQRVVTIGANVLGASVGNVAHDVMRASTRCSCRRDTASTRADRSRTRTRSSRRWCSRSASRSC